MHKVLIIQTAFIGDVVLATAIAEKIHQHYPNAQIDFLLRKGNESLLEHHPFINKIWIWDKKSKKLKNLIRLALQIRKSRYTHVINPHRFASSGLITAFSGADYKSGFTNNPLSSFYTHRLPYISSKPQSTQAIHEIQRNQTLISAVTNQAAVLPKLYPSIEDEKAIKLWQMRPYICLAPASVWFTKQFPAHKWVQLINQLPNDYAVYLLGGKGKEQELCDTICTQTKHENCISLSGKLSFLQSAALMKGAEMNYVNDSAPLHFCSAVDAPVTAIFCSTIPAFGFGPLSTQQKIVEIKESLICRPCGLHGRKACPLGHFNCAEHIEIQQLL